MDIVFCYIITYIIEAIILRQYCTHLFHAKYTQKISRIILFFLYSILFALVWLEQFWLNAIAFISINFLYIWCMHRVRYSTAIFHAAITTILMGMGELIIFSVRSHFTSSFFSDSHILKNVIILTISSKTLYFIFLQIILHFFKTKYKSYNKTSLLLTMVPIATVFVMVTLFGISLIAPLSPLLEWMISISAILLLATNLFVFSIYDYNQRKESEYAELQLQLQKESDAAEYYRMLLQENENRSILIHDIKKHLHSIASLNEQGKTEKISFYINTLLNSSSLQSSVRVCDHELLNAIICRYQRSCAEKSISFRTDIRSKSIHFISDNDLTSLFCNLLDNALTAATMMPEGYIELTVSRKQNTDFTVVTVINSCRYNPFDEYGRLITHKPNHTRHGFGMKSIQRIVNKYNGEMTNYFDDESKTFHTILLLRNENITL